MEDLFDSLIESINNKLAQQEKINSALTKELEAVNSRLVALTNALAANTTTTTPTDEKNNSDRSSNGSITNFDLTTLPAYKYTKSFQEIKRPVNFNELYMSFIQMQHALYELQTHTDNISRRG